MLLGDLTSRSYKGEENRLGQFRRVLAATVDRLEALFGVRAEPWKTPHGR
jgi:predicted aminopeptidase